MVQEIIQYITWFIWPRRAATQMAKGVKTLNTRLCAPTYTRLMRTRNSKTQFNEENYRCFAPQLCPQPQKSKIRRVRDEVFLRAPTKCPNEISKGGPTKFHDQADCAAWWPKSIVCASPRLHQSPPNDASCGRSLKYGDLLGLLKHFVNASSGQILPNAYLSSEIGILFQSCRNACPL